MDNYSHLTPDTCETIRSLQILYLTKILINSITEIKILKSVRNFRAQVVGWPPVRSFRKNVMSGQKPTTGEAVEGADKTSGSSGATSSASAGAVAYVKVSMDGAPYLRKIDLKLYKTYQDISDALSKMFSSFTIGK